MMTEAAAMSQMNCRAFFRRATMQFKALSTKENSRRQGNSHFHPSHIFATVFKYSFTVQQIGSIGDHNIPGI